MDSLDTQELPAALEHCYAIRCSQAKGHAVFHPARQLLEFVGRAVDAKVALGFSTSRLLELLILRADMMVSREEILAYAWPERVVTQSSLNQAISSLRELLGDEQAREIIQTVPRRGYQFNSLFLVGLETINYDPASSVSQDTGGGQVLADVSRRFFSGRFFRRDWWLPLLVVVCLLGGLVWRVNWTLLLQPGLKTSIQQAGNHRLLYIAPDESRLQTLETELNPLRDRLLALADSPGTLVFNRMYKSYDVACIKQDNTVSFLLIHQSQLASVTDKQLLECLQ